MGKKRTQTEFISDMKSINPNVEILGAYIDNRTHIAVRCLKHNIVWKQFLNNYISAEDVNSVELKRFRKRQGLSMKTL